MILNGAFKTNNDAKIRNREERGPTHDALKLEGQSSVFESVVKTEMPERKCCMHLRALAGRGAVLWGLLGMSVDCQQHSPA